MSELVWLLLLVAGIVWFVFPFVVIRRLDELLEQLRRIAKNTDAPAEPPKAKPAAPARKAVDPSQPDPEDAKRVAETLRRIESQPKPPGEPYQI